MNISYFFDKSIQKGIYKVKNFAQNIKYMRLFINCLDYIDKIEHKSLKMDSGFKMLPVFKNL